MYEKKLFSVLIANYNNGLFLEECLQSIYNQTYKNWEIVIVDDASTDNSHMVYEKCINDPRVRVLKNKKNKGCGYTKRKCVENAKGEICGFVDPDDSISPNALELMVNKHEQNHLVSIVYSTHYICDEHLNPINIASQVGSIHEGNYSWMNIRPIISHFATFKTYKYLQTRGIDAWLQKAVDKDLYYKLEKMGPVLFINLPLYNYRIHSNNISLKGNRSLAYQFHLAIKALIAIDSHNLNKTVQLMPHTKQQLAYSLVKVGFYLILTPNAVNGLKLILKSIAYYPFQIMEYLPKLLNKVIRR